MKTTIFSLLTGLVIASLIFVSCKGHDDEPTKIPNESIPSDTIPSDSIPVDTTVVDTTNHNAKNVEMVLVEGGTYQMGYGTSGNTAPIHSVTVNGFYISKYEITSQQYIDFLNSYKSDTIKEGEYVGTSLINNAMQKDANGIWILKYLAEKLKPISYITWASAVEYCKWAGGRLPTEAEWEYAARGGNQSHGYTYSGSYAIDSVAWYSGNAGGWTQLVGQKKANELGIYDMSGNVYEFCSDWYDATYYTSSPTNNPQGAVSGTFKILRGGGYGCPAGKSTVYYRESLSPSSRLSDTGFRLVRN